jgi:hypothetical protein
MAGFESLTDIQKDEQIPMHDVVHLAGYLVTV